MLALVCLVGAGVSATILNVHWQIESLGDGYTSFCNVNSSINCDVVLSSRYAKLAGIPVAWLALVAYVGMAALFGAAAASADAARRRSFVALGTAAVIGSLAFSGYMAFVSVFLVQAICLLCTALYVVALLNAGVIVSMLGGHARSGEPPPLGAGAAAGLFGAAVAALVALGWFTVPSDAPLGSSIGSADEVKASDPEFYAWFTALPKVDVATLLREDQLAKLDRSKVVIVDFFDLQCGHCRKNYQLTKKLEASRPGMVQLVHRHFPLDATCNDVVDASMHPNACRSAEAVECAGLMGKHDEMLDILFENQTQLFEENLVRLAGKIGLDKAEMQKCLDEHRTLPLVLADCRAGAKLEITSTPTVFVGGRRIKGVLEEVGKYEKAVLIETAALH